MPASPAAPLLTGLVCTDDAVLGDAVGLLVHVSGFEVLTVVETVAEAIAVSRQAQPSAFVLDLAACGVRGIPAVRDVLEVAPTCALVVVSPFAALADAALQAGATVVVDPTDLRPLTAVLAQVRADAHAGFVCLCCNPPATATVFHPGSSTVSPPQGAGGLVRGTGSGPRPGISSATDATDSQGTNPEDS